MTPAIGLVTPVKAALGEWLTGFYAQFYPDTPAAVEWAARGTVKAMAWAPARMVDAVEDMLASWRKNDNSGGPSTSAYLPVVFIAVASDYTDTPGEAGRPLTDYMPISFDGDALHRSFRARLLNVDLRSQVVIVASDPLTAQSIMGQICMWAVERRTFKSRYAFAGFTTEWPVQIVGADRMAIPTPVGDQITILSVDLTVRATLPMFYGPANGAPNDGNTPPGYPVLTSIPVQGHDPTLGPPTGVSAEEWARFRFLTGAPLAPADDAGNGAVVMLAGVRDEARP
jgi:hypothetical protein